mmetsp:Transcript_6413/g.15984  ORF Transcript_6413/g.15984 Transcript_6413/m.15984 type:complete len:164 (-) Transcript_6413:956-1447(-)
MSASASVPFKGLAGGTTEGAEAFLRGLLASESFDRQALAGLHDFRFEPGRCVCRFPVLPHVQNRYGTLHGGCVATLVDVVSTAALVTVSAAPGVSVDLGVSFMSPGPSGQEVEVDAEVLRVGKSLAFLEVTIRTVNGGRLVAKGTHTKFLPGLGYPPPPTSML